ncbi:MAG: dTDP-4-dehydrorhamnose 3,5-epimerase family protein [Patescibacteria group bacterium]|jgi:dTDP-4-dehydrorhamnose 3,5-epimerase-like enzyme
MSNHKIETEIEGCVVDLMPIFGDANGGVLHMLPNGTSNSDWFKGENILDVYAFMSTKQNTLRGGHYHPILEEMFFTITGTALWILSDFRESSPTYKKTIAIILGNKAPTKSTVLPDYTQQTTQSLARLTVPAGVYHAISPLSPEGFTTIALGTTPYNKDDYQYPNTEDVPNMKNILETFNINLS